MNRYNSITYPDLNNGPGCRVSIFLQGCPIHCFGCFNSELWNFDGGREVNDETLDTIHSLVNRPYIKGLSILGGEPLCEENLQTVAALCDIVKAIPDKTVWIYTGYNYESFNEGQKQAIDKADVVVDGKFEKGLYNHDLIFKGSKNQRIIDWQKTKNENRIILVSDYTK